MRVQNNFSYKNLVGTQTVQLATGVGTLHTITVNKTDAFPITVVDGNGGTTATIGILKASVAEGTYLYDCVFGAGLRLVVDGQPNVTVTYNVGS